MPARVRVRPLVFLALALLGGSAAGPRCGPGDPVDLSDYVVVSVAGGPGFEANLREALIGALPGTVIELPAGTFPVVGTFTVESSHVMVRGAGMDQTILDFSGQQFGAQGFLALGDHFAIRDLTILDPRGDGVKTQGITGARFERIKVEWTGGPSLANGAYGLYPAENTDVAVLDCVVKGARDAGIYVGQSENIVVQRNHVEDNVLGIEIENSVGAEVSYNTATGNTAGIAVFNLQNLRVDATRTRVSRNVVFENNEPNFAAGGILALVPAGVGVIAIAPRDVEIDNNFIWGNQTVNVIVSSFLMALEAVTDPTYDPYAERVTIRNNTFGAGGTNPVGFGAIVAGIFTAQGVPDIVIGGWVDPAKIPGFDPGVLPWVSQVLPENRICLRANTSDHAGPLAGHMNGYEDHPGVDRYDVSSFDCTHPSLPPIALPDAPPVPPPPPGLTPAERDALCNAPGTGVNWDAFIADCPFLDQYRLFAGDDPRGVPRPGGMPYDLNTALHSDFARKDRYVFVPPGEVVGYPFDERTPLDFPVGTIIAKTFSFQDTSGPAPVDRVVETRLLIRRAGGWQGLPYLWVNGRAELRVSGWVESGLTVTDPAGTTHVFDYQVPDATMCGSCHFGSDGDEPLGPKPAQLNRLYDYPGGTVDQLQVWRTAFGLVGAPLDTSVQPPVVDTAAVPRFPDWTDPSDGTREQRVKAYLDANCAHCHNPYGRAGFTSLHLGYDHPVDVMYGVCKKPIAAGAGGLGKEWDIDPGRPQDSILLLRMDSVDPAIMMPELSKALVDDAAVALVADWIELDLAPLAGTCVP